MCFPTVLPVFSFFRSQNDVLGPHFCAQESEPARVFWRKGRGCTSEEGCTMGTHSSYVLVVMWGQRFLFVPATSLPAFTRSRGGAEKVGASAYVFGEVCQNSMSVPNPYRLSNYSSCIHKERREKRSEGQSPYFHSQCLLLIG